MTWWLRLLDWVLHQPAPAHETFQAQWRKFMALPVIIDGRERLPQLRK